MKTVYTIIVLVSTAFQIKAQTISDFESFSMPQDSFLNGSDGANGFQDGNIHLSNSFTDFGYFTAWNGWAISSETDNITPGFNNEYSCISGKGNRDSQNYATSYIQGKSMLSTLNEAAGGVVQGAFFNNSTYAYYSMLNGDAFAKKFGGETGNDPDFLLLTIKKYHKGLISQDSINFYLADYRFADNQMDYLIDEWTYVDLSVLGNVDSLQFTLSSSDVGAFGMNTPSYFCMDDLTTADMLSANNNLEQDDECVVFPNPVDHYLQINFDHKSLRKIYLLNATGQIVMNHTTDQKWTTINMTHLQKGAYQLMITSKEAVSTRTILKI